MRVEGGTHTGFVDPGAFAMPPGLAVRYDQPATVLAPFVSAYNVYAARSPASRLDWFIPAGPMLCVPVDAGPIEIEIGDRTFAAPSGGFVLGPTGRAYRSLTHGGVLVGIGLTAGGWARLTDRPARDFYNAIAPLDAVLGEACAGELVEAVTAAPSDAALKPLLDPLLALLLLRQPHADDRQIAALTSILLIDGVTEVGDVALRIGADPHTLRRLALRYFGMPPKLLLRRARFMRSWLTFLDEHDDRNRIDVSYHDLSHFLRDSRAFLGTTPRRFLRLEGDFLRASIRARAAVFGVAAQVLHDTAPLMLPER